MLESYVLRLRRDALREGVVAGEVENVEAGTRATLRSVDDLVGFLCDSVMEPSPLLLSSPEEEAL